MSFDEIGKRMKENYEIPSGRYLPKKSNVIIRVDGKAFHTYTRGFEKPYDEIMSKAMCYTMLELCSNIQGARFGYTQSDEITIVLHDKMDIKSDAWFGYNQSKMESVSASIATAAFNSFMSKYKPDKKPALFDSRSFVIPLDYEVLNNILWRQLDAARNSIQGYAQSMFSHKELMNKNTKEMQEMMFQKNGLNWASLSADKRIGWMCMKSSYTGKWETNPAADIRTEEGKQIVTDSIFPEGILK